LIELVLVVSLVGVLMAIALPKFQDYRARMRVDQAQKDIIAMSASIDLYWQDVATYPPDLNAVRLNGKLDPWGHPYVYLRMGDPGSAGQARKDRALVPLNTDYDLYSSGADGASVPALTANASKDDILRANNGRFVGPAWLY
jgi:general secretion pathway protein G